MTEDRPHYRTGSGHSTRSTFVTLTTEEYQQLVWREMREKAWQERVRRLFLQYGWRHVHHHRSQHSAAGFPDNMAVRVRNGRCRLVAAELKREGQYPSEEQYAWLADLQMAGAECYVWHPHDEDDVIAVLSAGTGREVV